MSVLNELYKYMLVKENIDKINNEFNDVDKINNNLSTKKQVIKDNYEVRDYYSNLLINIILDINKNKFLIKKINTNEYGYKLKTEINYYFLEKFQELEKSIKEKKIVKPKLFKINDIITDLGNDQNMSLTCFIACCFIEKINILLINKKIASYIENDIDITNNKFYNVYIDSINIKSHISSNIIISDYDSFKNEYYIVDNILKPMYSISHYKVDELRIIASYLNISTNIENNKQKKTKNKTKAVLYKEIMDYMSII
jgi:hypothetical protein